MYKNLNYLSTKDMSREEWLAERRKGIGGSDAPSITGHNEYNSAYSLWAEKTGAIVKEDISDKEAVRLGNDLEQYVAERFMDATGKKVRRCNNIITNPDLPFAHANVDRLVVGEDAGLECKTTSSWDIIKECREGKVPYRYYVQCVHYMMVTGAQKWYLGVLGFGSGFFWFEIKRNDAEIAALAEAERVFWQKVESKESPAIDGAEATTEALKTIFADGVPGSSVDLTGVGGQIEIYNQLTKDIAELEKLRDEQANIIKNYMGTAESGSYGNTKISWKTSSRKTFDKAAYEKANGKIPDNFYKTSESRTFRVTVKN